jgi:signal peptidase II
MHHPAGRSRAAPAVLAGTALVVYVADQLTKAIVVAALDLGERVRVIGDLVQVWNVRNFGAAFSLFQGGFVLFMVVTVFALGMVAYFHHTFRLRPLRVHAILGLVLGGTLGNLTDRLRHEYVVDWLSVGLGDLRWPTFNVADASVVVGIGLLVGYLVFFDRDRTVAAA